MSERPASSILALGVAPHKELAKKYQDKMPSTRERALREEPPTSANLTFEDALPTIPFIVRSLVLFSPQVHVRSCLKRGAQTSSSH